MHPTRIGSLSGRGLTSSARPGEAFHREKVYVKQRGNPRMCCITQLHHPGFSLNIRHTFMGHNFATVALSWLLLGTHFLVPFRLLLMGFVDLPPTHRYVYVPNEENSSKSLEMERIMREARFGNFYQNPLSLFNLSLLECESSARDSTALPTKTQLTRR